MSQNLNKSRFTNKYPVLGSLEYSRCRILDSGCILGSGSYILCLASKVLDSGSLWIVEPTWLLRKCFPILQSYWGGCHPPDPSAFLGVEGCRPPPDPPSIKLEGLPPPQTPPHFLRGEGCRPPPQTPPTANYEGLRPSNSPQEIGKTIGAGL